MEMVLKHIGGEFNKKTHNKLQEQANGIELKIIALYRTETKYGGTYIFYDTISNKTFYGNAQLNGYIEAILKNNYNVFTIRNKQG
jgi:hypothetical protein